MQGGQVDLVVNVFERTYRDVLTPRWWEELAESTGYPFTRRVALINNTRDPDHARTLAEQLVTAGSIDECHFVADRIEAALDKVGLAQADLGPVPHYSDCAFVALALPGSDHVVYWDADLTLRSPCDWVTPSLELMGSDPRIVAANPCWDQEEARREAFEERGQFAIGYGFSDWAFLAHRPTFLGQSWKGLMAPASYRYPLAHVAPVFEQRVDSWMRRNRLLRATFLPATMSSGTTSGTHYPNPTRPQRARRRLQSGALRLGQRLLPDHPLTTPYPRRPA